MATQAKQLIVNPSDASQMMVLWDNGTITTVGGAPSPSGNPTWNNDPVGNPARALRIIDWSTPSGYTMDWYGIVHNWGGAPAVVGQVNGGGGFDAGDADLRIAVDFHLNITGGGNVNGHVLDVNGRLWEFGAAAPITTGLSLNGLARRLINDYTNGHKWILDARGGLHALEGAPEAIGEGYWSVGDMARAFDLEDWSKGRGWVMDLVGGLHSVNGAGPLLGGPYWASGGDIARDFRVLSADDPQQYAILDYLGNVHVWRVSDAPSCFALAPSSTVTNTTRPTIGYLYDDTNDDSMQEVDLVLFKTSDISSFVNEKQRITLNGATSGQVKFILEGHAVTWNYNASTSTVQTAIRTLPGCSTCTVTGSAGDWVIEYKGVRGAAKQPFARIVKLLNDGAGISYTRDQRGTDPFGSEGDALKLWDATITDPAIVTMTLDFDLEDGTYRLYARAQDSSNQFSGVTSDDFTMSVIHPAPPTLQAGSKGGLFGNAVIVHVSSPPAGAYVQVECSDDGVNWHKVRGPVSTVSYTVGLTTTTGKGLLDTEAPFGVSRQYRARIFVPSPWLTSNYSPIVTATLTGPMWVISNPKNDLLQTRVTVIPPFEFSEGISSYTSPIPAGAKNPVVIRDGGLKGGKWSFKVRTLSKSAHTALMTVLDTADQLLLRDIFGRCWYFKIPDDVKTPMLKAGPLASETTTLRYAHEVEIPVQEVSRDENIDDYLASSYV